MSKITHQSLDSRHENLCPWTNTTFQLHTFLLRLKKTKSLGQLKAHTKSSSSSPLSETSHKNRLLGFAKNHGFSRFQVCRLAIARALSQNIDPNNGDDVKNGLSGVKIRKERSIWDPGRRDLQTFWNYTQDFLCTCIFSDENRHLDNFNQNGRLGIAPNKVTRFLVCLFWRDMKMNVVTASYLSWNWGSWSP